jgi:hypothetical protein
MVIIIRIPSSEMLRRVARVRTDISEEFIASIIRVIRICELGITLEVTSHEARCAPILVTLMEAIRSSETHVLTRPHGVICQTTAFFKVTALKTSDLTW